MKNKLFYLVLSLLLSAPVFADSTKPKSTPYRLLFITVDGVRFQEVYKKGMIKARDDFWFFGDRNRGQKMKIANKAALSVPGYQSIYSGIKPLTTCRNNECSYVKHETFMDRLQAEYQFGFNNMALISAWYNVRYGATQKPGNFFINTGLGRAEEGTEKEYIDPRTGEVPEELKHLIDKPMPPWNHRWDIDNFEYSLWYLKNIQPKVLAVGFLNPDEFAHHKQWVEYDQSVKDMDTYIQGYLEYLDKNPEIGDNTHIILTTDHGRGRWFLKPKHDRWILSSRRVWAMVRPAKNWLKENPNVGPSCKRKVTHAALRTTVEALMDLEPRQGPEFEAPLLELKTN